MRYRHDAALLPDDAVGLVKRALEATESAYSSGPSYISATQLVGEPLVRQLRQRNPDLTADILDSTWSLFGSAVHTVLEKGEGPGDFHERRFFAWFPTWPDELSHCCEAEVIPGEEHDGQPITLNCRQCSQDCSWVVSGQADLLTGAGTLYDFKVTSAWAFRLEADTVKAEWEGQLNVLAHIIRNRHWYYPDPSKAHEPQSAVLVREGLPVKAARIFAFLRDWSPTQAEANTTEAKRKGEEPDYPLTPMLVVEAPLWSHESAVAFFEQRVKLHATFDHADPRRIPECSPGMRWFKGDSWAVLKLTAKGERPKRATRVYDNERDAWALHAAITNEGKEAVVELRPGESTKCVHYCSVREVCPYGRSRAVKNRIAAHAKEREAAGFKVQRW
jgi:hypothetical protein